MSATAKAFIKPDIDAGSLQVLFEDEEDPGTGYHMLTRQGVKRPALEEADDMAAHHDRRRHEKIGDLLCLAARNRREARTHDKHAKHQQSACPSR